MSSLHFKNVAPLKEFSILISGGGAQMVSEYDELAIHLSKNWTSCQGLIDAFPFYVLVITDQHRIVLANRAVLNDFGVAPEDLIGRFCPKAIHGLDEHYPGCPLEEAVAKGNITVETELFDGTYERWFKSGVYPIGTRTENGRMQFLHILQDIHDQKMADQQIRSALDGVVHALGATVASRDPYTSDHQRRVEQLTSAVARTMQLSTDNQEALHIAATVHDIGKIAVPAEILSKPGRLTDIEYQLVKAHPQYAFDILRTIDFPWPVAEIILQHHERLDGSGYPSNLSAAEICLEARILAVADVVEAMASHRPYRPALGIDAALEEITSGRGTLYDPDVVDACRNLFLRNEFHFD